MAFKKIYVDPNTWVLLSESTTYYQPLGNEIFTKESETAPLAIDDSGIKSEVGIIYGYDKKIGNLYGYSKKGSYVIVTDSIHSVMASQNTSFELAVSMGLVNGYSFIDKYGENPDVDTGSAPEDITEIGGLYLYDDALTAPIVSLVSDDILDTMDIEVVGLDIDGFEVTQTIALKGTTRVALITPLYRVFIMANVDSFKISGTVYCYTGIGDVPLADEIRAIIVNGNNETLMAVYTVPRGKVGFLYRGELGGSRSQNSGAIQCSYYSRRFGKVFRIKKRVDITNQGTSVYIDKRSFPDVIPALTDIKLSVESVSNNNTGVFGAFDIMLVDENKFSKAYLEKIGQPYV